MLALKSVLNRLLTNLVPLIRFNPVEHWAKHMATLNLISTSFFRFSSFQYFIFKTLSTTFEDNLLLYMRSKGKTIFLQYFSIAAFTFVRSILSIRNVIEAHKTNMSHICFHCCRRFYIFSFWASFRLCHC